MRRATYVRRLLSTKSKNYVSLTYCCEQLNINNIIKYRLKLQKLKVNISKIVRKELITLQDYVLIQEQYTSHILFDEFFDTIINEFRVEEGFDETKYYHLRYNAIMYIKAIHKDILDSSNEKIFTVEYNKPFINRNNIEIAHKSLEIWLSTQLTPRVLDYKYISLSEILKCFNSTITPIDLIQKIQCKCISSYKVGPYLVLLRSEYETWLNQLASLSSLKTLIKATCNNKISASNTMLQEILNHLKLINYYNLKIFLSDELLLPSKITDVFYKKDDEEILSNYLNDYIKEFQLCSLQSLKEISGLSLKQLVQLIKNNKIKAVQKENCWYVSLKTKEEIIKFNKQYIGIFNLVNKLCQETDTLYTSNLSKNREDLCNYLEVNQYFGANCLSSDSVFLSNVSDNPFFVKISTITSLQKQITEWLKTFKRSDEEKLNYYFNEYGKIFPKTIKSYQIFIEKSNKNLCTHLLLIQTLLPLLKKEIIEYTDGDRDRLIIALHKNNLSKLAEEVLADWLYFLMNTEEVNYEERVIPKKDSKNQKKSEAYAAKQFMTMAYFIFNEEHWMKENLIQKAISNRSFSQLWLFIALHFVCSFRPSDIFNLAKFTLPYPPLKMLEIIKDNAFTQEMALNIITQIEMEYEYLTHHPSKSLRYNCEKNLKFFVPEGAIYPLGLMFTICEIHRSVSKSKKTNLIKCSPNIYVISSFFGKEMADVLENRNFRSIRANRAYLQGLEFEATKHESPGNIKGYMIASIARAHKGHPYKLSNTTEIYLKDAKFTGYTPEFIAYQMLERGVCSFVPYLLLQIVNSNIYNKLSISKQTLMIKNIGITPDEIETTVQIIDISLQKAAEIVNNLILKRRSYITRNGLMKVYDKVLVARKRNLQHIRVKNLKTQHAYLLESISRIVASIATGEAVAKQEHCMCLLIAQGEKCKYPKKKICLKCGNEVYTKSLVYYLNYEKVRLEDENNEKDVPNIVKEKNNYILNKYIIPTLKKILIEIKNTYEYKDLQFLIDMSRRI